MIEKGIKNKIMGRTRNYGIDLLRIALMFFIVIGHLFVHTGIREEVAVYSGKWIFTWSMQSITVCAVNCFILITGYYMSTTEFSMKKVLKLWGQVLFFSIIIYVTAITFNITEFSFVGIIHSLFPVFSHQYWFFSCYILLYILTPFINAMLKNLNDKLFKWLVAILVFFFYLLPIFSIVFKQYDGSEGMSIIGFLTLYVFGAAIRRFAFKISKWKCLIGLLINCTLVFSSKIVLTIITSHFSIDAGTGLFYHYNSIFQLINAILLFLFFLQLDVKGWSQKLIAIVSGTVFSVYLIHEHPALRGWIWSDTLKSWLMDLALINYILATITIAIGVFIICFFIEEIRVLLLRLIKMIKIARKNKE